VRSGAFFGMAVHGGKQVLLAQAEGEVCLPVSRGLRLIRGQFGILPEADERYPAGGVQFSIEYVPTGGDAIGVFKRHLDPRGNPHDRGMRYFYVSLPDSLSGEVLLKTSSKSEGEGRNSLSYWTDVEVR